MVETIEKGEWFKNEQSKKEFIEWWTKKEL